MDEYGGDIESTGVNRFRANNWSQLPKAFKALGRHQYYKKVEGRHPLMEKLIYLVSPSGGDVYKVRIWSAYGFNYGITVMGVFGEEYSPLVNFRDEQTLLFPGKPQQLDISNSDMPRNMLELFKRILTYPEIAIGEQDESGSADMAKRMAKKIGWRVDAGGYAM